MEFAFVFLLCLSFSYAFVRTHSSWRQVATSSSLKASTDPNQATNTNDPRLKDFLAGEGSKEWRGTKTMLQRRGEVPDSKYSPIDVIRVVLKALQTNDYPQLDHGACVVLEFRSPNGPLAVFSNPAELGAYLRKSFDKLVDFKEARLVGELQSTGDSVQQSVEVQSWESPTEFYTFYLTKTDNTWLVDAILKK